MVPIDGTWAMAPTPGGVAFSLDLVSRIGVDTPGTLVVNGTGRHVDQVGPNPPVGTMTAYGTYSSPNLHLTLSYDNGASVIFDGTATDPSTMDAKLRFANGSQQAMQLLKR